MSAILKTVSSKKKNIFNLKKMLMTGCACMEFMTNPLKNAEAVTIKMEKVYCWQPSSKELNSRELLSQHPQPPEFKYVNYFFVC